jgi:solute carrier family 50 (sugar transporter)
MSSSESNQVFEGDSSDTSANSNLLAAFMTLGSLINVFVFTAQVPLMRTIRKEGNSEKYSPLPSQSMLLMTCLWMWYTFYYQPDRIAFYLNNGGGLLMALFYLYFHARYAPTPQFRNKIIMVAVGIMLFATILYVGAVNISSLEAAKNPCAMISVAINVAFFISPLKALWTALKELDTKRVPVLLSVFTFMGSFSWSTVGILIGDNFIAFPNLCGFVLTTIQLGILVYIRKKAPKKAAIDAAAATAVPTEGSESIAMKGGVAGLPCSSDGVAAAVGVPVKSIEQDTAHSAEQHAALVKAHWQELGYATESLFAKVSAKLGNDNAGAASNSGGGFEPVYMRPPASSSTQAPLAAAALPSKQQEEPRASSSIINHCDDSEYGRVTSSCCMKDEAKAQQAVIAKLEFGASSWDSEAASTGAADDPWKAQGAPTSGVQSSPAAAVPVPVWA